MAAAGGSRGFHLLCVGSSRRLLHFGSGTNSPKLSSYFIPSSRSLSTPVRAAPQRKEQTIIQPTVPSPALARPNVVKFLEERGLLDSLTSDKLKSDCLSPLRVYCGFDPTAPSLHLGNLLGIIVLSWFLKCGHTAVALVGGATGRVGDPSGKSTERPELDPHTLDANIHAISRSLETIILRDSSPNSFAVMNNYDWWKDVKLLDFLKEVGRFARVGTMMSKDSVRRRLEDSEGGMSYTEFTYQLLQGYDFVHLFRNEGVGVQIGGSDQWGNITAGTDLIRRIGGGTVSVDRNAYGLTFPLLLKSDGSKFGKSEEGAVWLCPSMLSPYKFYQHFFTVPDSDVIVFLKRLTFLAMEEIADLEGKMSHSDYVPNTAQRVLAEEVTRFVHGQEGLNEAIKATEALRPGGGGGLMDSETIEGMIGQDVPSCDLCCDQVLGVSIIDLLVLSGLMETKSAARRLLKQGGIYLNNIRVENEGKRVESDDIIQGKILLLSAGKKNRIVVRIF